MKETDQAKVKAVEIKSNGIKWHHMKSSLIEWNQVISHEIIQSQTASNEIKGSQTQSDKMTGKTQSSPFQLERNCFKSIPFFPRTFYVGSPVRTALFRIVLSTVSFVIRLPLSVTIYPGLGLEVRHWPHFDVPPSSQLFSKTKLLLMR